MKQVGDFKLVVILKMISRSSATSLTRRKTCRRSTTNLYYKMSSFLSRISFSIELTTLAVRVKKNAMAMAMAEIFILLLLLLLFLNLDSVVFYDRF